jgi:energy-coupling factor transporter ATP-binding protein EcfA2
LAKFNDDNKYGALQNKLDKSLIDAIIANAIAYRPFLLEVVNKIEPEHFSERDEVHISLLWRAIQSLYNKQIPTTIMSLHMEYQVLLGQCSDEITEAQYNDLFSENPQQPGIIHYALNDFIPEAENMPLLRQLVRTFLEQRELVYKMTKFAATSQGGSYTDMSLFISDLQKTASRIGSVNVNPAHTGELVFSEQAVVEQFPTEIEFFDLIMAGGAFRGELNGLLGPTGGGKTTLMCQLAATVAKAFHRQFVRTGKYEIAFIATYEQPYVFMQAKMIAALADIHIDSIWAVLNAKNYSHFSTTGNLKTYEIQKYENVPQPHPGELERYQAILPILQNHIRILDFSGETSESLPGDGYVPELLTQIESTLMAAGERAQLGFIAADYVGIAVSRYLKKINKGTDSFANRSYIQDFADEIRTRICRKHNAMGWVLHQFNKDGNTAAPTKLLKHTDASECSTFANPLAFVFCVGTKDESSDCVFINPSKTRHSGETNKPGIFKINGKFARLDNVDGSYEADRVNRKFIPKNEARQVGLGGNWGDNDDEEELGVADFSGAF